MAHKPYPYKQIRSKQYIFISAGNRRVEKIVEFIPFGLGNIMNLGFGDLLSNGFIDDKANSNNGDIARVIATVIEIVKHFTTKHPGVIIYFCGNTDQRTKLYGRILKSYYQQFSVEFTILAIIGTETDNKTIPFDPGESHEYLAFLIKRIS
jgi:hypothetical protein